jgi:hypothetical protein
LPNRTPRASFEWQLSGDQIGETNVRYWPGRRNAANTRARELIVRRLRKNRAMSSVTLRMPEDVVEDLKRVAPILGFAGDQPLIRAYIGKGLRIDLARLDEGSAPRLITSLKRKGVADSLIQQALAETDQAT